MKVMKFGGGCLKDPSFLIRTAGLIEKESLPPVVVVSAVYGVTDLLMDALKSALVSESLVLPALDEIEKRHRKMAEEAIPSPPARGRTLGEIQLKLRKLERLLFGVAYTGELSDSVKAAVASYGERLAALLLAGVLHGRGLKSLALDSENVGILTDDFLWDSATADMESLKINSLRTILPLLTEKTVPIITGFYGLTPSGKVTTFGRNGSDYTAAILAAALEAGELEIWKDVEGFMSADPKIVPGAERLESVSFYEAAELSYFGAKILHPRTVEPLRGQNIDIRVKNLLSPEGEGTKILPAGEKREGIIKSVTFNRNLARLRILGPGVGCKPGIIGRIGDTLSGLGINIFSVLTSQTCINLLIHREESGRSLEALGYLKEGTVETIDLLDDIALIAVVGEGILSTNGVAARVFSAVSAEGINVEMISAGASEVAYYFIVRQEEVLRAVRAIHREFFERG